jgi:hypothetical protein
MVDRLSQHWPGFQQSIALPLLERYHRWRSFTANYIVDKDTKELVFRNKLEVYLSS